MKIDNIAKLKEELSDAIKKYTSIAIVTHKNPDGDGLPAALALQEIIAVKEKKADVILERSSPEIYEFLNGEKRTQVFSNHHYYEFLIILDCHEKTRIGACAPLIPTASKIISIDHHKEGELIENSLTYIDTNMVSVGAILFNLFESELNKFPKKSANYIAKAIYTTILNDTDNFINTNTDAETFRICSQLMEYNIKPGYITEHFLLNKPPKQMKFIGEVLSKIQTYEDDQILFMGTTLEMLEQYNLDSEATSKLTRWVKGTRGIKATVCFQEINSRRYRLSLRSNDIDVNKIAVKFGGGGHIKASGCEIKGSLPDIKKQIIKEIRKQL